MRPADADPPVISQRRIHTLGRKTLVLEWWSEGRAYLLAILVGAICIAGALLCVSWGRRLIQADKADAPLRTGEAMVKRKSYSMEPKSARIRMGITISLGNQEISLGTENTDKWLQAQIGQPVTVKYRAGRSGQVYVEDWQPPVVQTQVPVHRGGN